MRYQIHILLEGGENVHTAVKETDGGLADASRELNRNLGADRFTIEDEHGALITIRSQYVMAAGVTEVASQGEDGHSPRFEGLRIVSIEGVVFRCFNTTHYHGPEGLAFPCPQCMLVKLEKR